MKFIAGSCFARVGSAIRAFFQFYETQNDRLREESIAPLLNKVSKFITNPILRMVIGQMCSNFDFRWAMDNKDHPLQPVERCSR